MVIVRNGVEYKLTDSEIRNIFTTMKKEYLREDVESKAEEMGVNIPEEYMRKVVDRADKYLSHNDSYYECYWMSIECAVNECADEYKI